MHKRGQFFLIAALIIVAILLTLSGIYTKAVTAQEDPQLPALASEIKAELAQGIDYAVATGTDVDEIVQNLTAIYAYNHPTKEIVVVYGPQSDLRSLYYKNGEKMPSTDTVLSGISSNTTYLTLAQDQTFELDIRTAHPQAIRIFAIIRSTNGDQKTTIIR